MLWRYICFLLVGTVWGGANFVLSILSKRQKGEKEHKNKNFAEFVKYLVKNWKILLVVSIDKLSTVLYIIATQNFG